MWKLWVFFGIFKISFGAPVGSSNKNSSIITTDFSVLSCLLLASPSNICDPTKRHENLPTRIQKLYSMLTTTQNEILDSKSMESLPTTLLYLLPRVRLGNMTGQIAAAILRKTPQDEALTNKLVSLLKDDSNRKAFLHGLSGENTLDPLDYEDEDQKVSELKLSPAVESEIGRTLTGWYPVAMDWQFWHFESTLAAGSPIMASLASHFLQRLNQKVAIRFLFHLRNWRWWDSDPSSKWSKHVMAVKRIWAYMMLTKADHPYLWSPRLLRQQGFLLLGATPDELHSLPTSLRLSKDASLLLNLEFTPMQTRAAFDVIHSEVQGLGEISTSWKLLANLLPRQIQQFDPNLFNISTSNLNNRPIPSLATKKQLFEHILAHEALTKDLSLSPSGWKNNIAPFGSLIEVIPASTMELLEHEEFPVNVINKLASDALSYRQLRYLTRNGQMFKLEDPETIISSGYLLKGMPAAAIFHAHNDLIPIAVKLSLLKFVRVENNYAMATVLIEKFMNDLDEVPFFKAMLENDNYQQLLSLLNSRDILPSINRVTDTLTTIASQHERLVPRIRALPPNIGSTIIGHYRRQIPSEDGWTMENLILHPQQPILKLLISNLQCEDIYFINDADVVPIIGYYNREKKLLKQEFPKNMQYCCQKALTRYLKLKAKLRQINADSTGLFNLLEPYEIKAIGGYTLSSLPLDLITSAYVTNQILREIGSLSLPELLSATNSVETLQQLAAAYTTRLNPYNLRDMSELGNLLWFVSEKNLNSSHVKIFLESLESDQSRAICLDSESREYWRENLIKAFGSPGGWSSGVVSLLGDLLVVFDPDELDLIPLSSLIESADILTSSTNYHKKIEWPGGYEFYYEACQQALPEIERKSYKNSVLTTLRFFLESAQLQLNTVVSAKSKLEEALNKVKRNVPQELLDEKRKKELAFNGSRSLVIEGPVSAEAPEVSRLELIQISCDAVKMLGYPAAWVLKKTDLERFDNLEDCVETLGSLDLPDSLKKFIFVNTKKWKEGGNLLELGNLVTELDEHAISNLNLDLKKPWTLENLSLLSKTITNTEQLKLIGDRFTILNTDFGYLKASTAASLGSVVCFLTSGKQKALLLRDSTAFRLAAKIWGQSPAVDDLCLKELAEVAKEVLGTPENWTREDVENIGQIITYLRKHDWSQTSPAALSGLTPLAVKRLRPEILKVLSEQQLAELPALSLAAITPAQESFLSPAQSEVVDRVRRQIPDEGLRASKTHSGVSRVRWSWTMGFLLVMSMIV